MVVSSHGLTSNRFAYLQLSGKLGSQGVIVGAMKHRHGSGISSVVRSPIYSRLSRKNQDTEKVRHSLRQISTTLINLILRPLCSTSTVPS